MTRTAVFFHAHPDDEAMLTAGTMATASANGDRVVLVVATRGERGDADATVAGGDLGGVRTAELDTSARALGVARVEVLDYLDSGSGPDSGGPGTFVDAPLDEAAARVAAILRDERADVLTIYDPHGGYGHPDHVRVHDVGRAAASLAGTPVVLEATISRDLLRLAVDVVPTFGLELPSDLVPPDLSTVYCSADEITHTVDVRDALAAKRASMEAHASQTSSAGTTVRTLSVFLALPDELFALAFGTEWYVDRRLAPGSAEHDIFSAVSL